jgi:hypothetical protein
MDLNGKKTERVLMRVSEDMEREVRALAELEHRPIQDQYRALIAEALQQRRSDSSNGIRKPPRRALSTDGFAEGQAKTVPSTTVKPGQLLLPGTAGPIAARLQKRRSA